MPWDRLSQTHLIPFISTLAKQQAHLLLHKLGPQVANTGRGLVAQRADAEQKAKLLGKEQYTSERSPPCNDAKAAATQPTHTNLPSRIKPPPQLLLKHWPKVGAICWEQETLTGLVRKSGGGTQKPINPLHAGCHLGFAPLPCTLPREKGSGVPRWGVW